MKSLELNLKKRLLIVEPENYNMWLKKKVHYNELDFKIYDLNSICRGSDLTEEIAAEMVDSMNFGTAQNPHIGYYDPIRNNFSHSSAVESFISAIKVQGWYWGQNPVSLEREEAYRALGDTFRADGILRAWQESESRTFHPEKVIIFEIVEG